MKKALLILGMCLTVFTAMAQDTEKLLKDYLQVKEALVESDMKAAAAAIQTFSETLNADADLQKGSLKKASDKLAKAGNLEQQRAAFADVSIAIWELVQQSNDLSADVYYQYCPMKKAYWLSAEPAIRNPYYGAKMLACGSVKDKKLK